MTRPTVPNPTQPGALRPARLISDRAKRYRAQKAISGPKRCAYCGGPSHAKRRLDVEHIDGREANGEPGNIAYACRSCNVRKAILYKRHRIGKKTVQYNPRAPHLTNYERFTKSEEARVQPFAEKMRRQGFDVEITPYAKSKASFGWIVYFGKKPKSNPKQSAADYGPAGCDPGPKAKRPAAGFAEYMWAVATVTGQNGDGEDCAKVRKAASLISHTSADARSNYARQIWSNRRRRGTDRGPRRRRDDDIPF